MKKTKIMNDMMVKYFASIQEGPGIGWKNQEKVKEKDINDLRF